MIKINETVTDHSWHGLEINVSRHVRNWNFCLFCLVYTNDELCGLQILGIKGWVQII